MNAGALEWFETTIGESFQTVTGNTPPKSKFDLYGDAIPLVKPPELNDGEVGEAADGLSVKGSKVARIAPVGSTLVSCIGNLGKIGLTTVEVAFNQQINAIFPAPGIADPQFVYFLTLSPQFRDQLLTLSSGTTVPIVNKSRFNSIKLLLPPLGEQKRIVAVLDQAFAALDRARAHAEANLADAEALFVRLAYDNLRKVAETGKFAPVGEISDHCLGKMLDRNKNKGTFRPYLRNINVRWFEVDTSDILEMRIEDRELDRYEVRKGDLLICEGGYPGRASIYEGDAPTYFQKALHRVRFSDESLAKVLMYWLFVEDKLGKLKDCFSGTGISHFTGKTLASYLMPMSDPPTNARAVENIDRHLAWTNSVISGYRQKLTDLANLRQSLLQKAFSGELT